MSEEAQGTMEEQDDFSLAFQVAVEGVPAEPPEPPASTEPLEPSAPAEPPEPSAPTEPSAPPEPSASSASAVPQSPTEPPAPTAEEIAKQEAEEKARIEAEAAALAEAEARENFTEDELAAITSTSNDFPDTAKALHAVARVAFEKAQNAFDSKLRELRSEFNTVLYKMQQDITPVMASAQEMAWKTHEAAILAVHPDAHTILPEVEKWIISKPDFMQKGMNEVLDKGNTQQVIELYNVFKKEQPGSVKGPPASTPTLEDKEKIAEQQKKLQSLEGVRSSHTAKKSGIDEDDFESAFKAAANS